MNIVILKGRLTKDPDIKYAQGQNGTHLAVASFTLAVNRPKKGEEQEADFIRCKAFGKTAEMFEKYVRQGAEVDVEGSIQTGSYTNKDGQKVYTTDVLVSKVHFCHATRSDGASTPKKPDTDDRGFMNIPDGIDEELPFH